MARSTAFYCLTGFLILAASAALAGPLGIEQTEAHSAQPRVEQRLGPQNLIDECHMVLQAGKEAVESYVHAIATVIKAVAKAVRVLVVTIVETVIRVVLTLILALAHAIASILVG